MLLHKLFHPFVKGVGLAYHQDGQTECFYCTPRMLRTVFITFWKMILNQIYNNKSTYFKIFAEILQSDYCNLACFIIFSAANKNDWWPCSTFMILSLKCFQNKSNIKFIKLEEKVHMRFLITYLFLKKGRRTMDLEHSLRPKMIHCGEMTKKHCVHFFEFPTSLRPRCIQPIHHNWAKVFLKSYLHFFSICNIIVFGILILLLLLHLVEF